MAASNSHQSSGLWVFGYGSLCWNPNFEYEQCCIGFIKGYRRNFSQGNIYHRGTRDKPGRVATLTEDKNGTVWGRAFLINGEAALNYLAERECKIGGYKTILAPVFTALENIDKYEAITAAAIVYIATPDNEHWLGDAHTTQLAVDICSTEGKAGHNIDYVLNLAKFIREYCPKESDVDLFQLEYEILKIKPDHICDYFGELQFKAKVPENNDNNNDNEIDNNNHRIDNDQRNFSARVPDKTLRCLKL